jgi:hypothetical protein
MDHEYYLVESNPSVRIKCAIAQYSWNLVWVSSHMDCRILVQEEISSFSLEARMAGVVSNLDDKELIKSPS